jgi:regulator of protease activity HflC (stomatin/prohibitin superfamily)
MDNFWAIFFFTLFVVLIFLAIFAIIRGGIEVVLEGTVGIVLRWGERNRVVPPGRHFLLPLAERMYSEVEVKEFTDVIQADSVMTKGATSIALDMSVTYRIRRYSRRAMNQEDKARLSNKPVVFWNNGVEVIAWEDVYRAAFDVDNWRERTRRESETAMYDYFTTIDYRTEIFNGQGNATRRIADTLARRVSDRTKTYGVEVLRINITRLEIDEETRNFLTAERRAWQEGQLRSLQARNDQSIRQILGMENDTDAYLKWRQIESVRELYKNPNVRLNINEDLPNASNQP